MKSNPDWWNLIAIAVNRSALSGVKTIRLDFCGAMLT